MSIFKSKSKWKRILCFFSVVFMTLVSGAFMALVSGAFGYYGSYVSEKSVKMADEGDWIDATPYFTIPLHTHSDNSHNGQINAICKTALYVITASDDHTLKLTELVSGKLAYTIKGIHHGDIQDVICTSDVIISSGNDSKINLINVSTKKYKQIYEEENGLSVLSLATYDNELYAGVGNQIVGLDMNDDYKVIRNYIGHEKGIYDISSSEKYLVSVSKDKTIVIFNRKTGKIVNRIPDAHEFKIHSGYIHGDYLATSSDRNLKIWKLPMGEIVLNISVNSHTGMNEVILTQKYLFVASHQSKSVEFVRFGGSFSNVVERETLNGAENHESIFLYNNCLFAGTTKGKLEIFNLGDKWKMFSMNDDKNYDLMKICAVATIDKIALK